MRTRGELLIHEYAGPGLIVLLIKDLIKLRDIYAHLTAVYITNQKAGVVI